MRLEVRPPAIEVFGVDSIHAEELEESLLEFVAENLSHAQILHWKAPSRVGETITFYLGVAKHEELHASDWSRQLH
jgi:hypothetical protein